MSRPVRRCTYLLPVNVGRYVMTHCNRVTHGMDPYCDRHKFLNPPTPATREKP